MSIIRTCIDCDTDVEVVDYDELAVCADCVGIRRDTEKRLHVSSGDPHGAGGRQMANNRGLTGLHRKK